MLSLYPFMPSSFPSCLHPHDLIIASENEVETIEFPSSVTERKRGPLEGRCLGPCHTPGVGGGHQKAGLDFGIALPWTLQDMQVGSRLSRSLGAPFSEEAEA